MAAVHCMCPTGPTNHRLSENGKQEQSKSKSNKSNSSIESGLQQLTDLSDVYSYGVLQSLQGS
jgi:hypothetical protein